MTFAPSNPGARPVTPGRAFGQLQEPDVTSALPQFCVHPRPGDGRACDNLPGAHEGGTLGHPFTPDQPRRSRPVPVPPPTRDWDTGPVAETPADELDIGEQKVAALLAELLDTDDLDNVPALRPVVAELLFLDSLARINGPSGHGKSFVSLDVAGHVAVGEPWHGRAVHQGLVVYLVAEGMGGIRKRVRAWEQHHGRKMTGVKFLPRPVQALDIEWFVLIEACRRLAPVLIIVDTQARVTVGVEENSATEMGRVVDRMEQLRTKTGACVVLIHHRGLNGDHGRGSTAVKGAMQTELSVTKDGKGAETLVYVATDKQKDSEEIDRLALNMRQVALDGEAEEDGRPVTSAVLVLDEAAAYDQPAPKLPPAATKLLATLRTLDRPLPNKEVIDRFAQMHGHGLRREEASRQLNALHKRGLVDRLDQIDGVVWTLSEKVRNDSA